jgi:small GTP-binding protein
MSKPRMNIMIIGDGKVGKTSILKMFDKKKFQQDHIKTIGVDFIKTSYTHDGQEIDVKLWDTAG